MVKWGDGRVGVAVASFLGAEGMAEPVIGEFGWRIAKALLMSSSSRRVKPHSPHHKLPRIPIHGPGRMVGGGKGHIERFVYPHINHQTRLWYWCRFAKYDPRGQIPGSAWRLYWAVLRFAFSRRIREGGFRRMCTNGL